MPVELEAVSHRYWVDPPCSSTGFFITAEISPREPSNGVAGYLIYERAESGDWSLIGTRMLLDDGPNPSDVGGRSSGQEGDVRFYQVRVLDKAGREHVVGDEIRLVLGHTDGGCACSAPSGDRASFGLFLMLLCLVRFRRR
jgi:MYXO-CTERM domain-containing protein